MRPSGALRPRRPWGLAEAVIIAPGSSTFAPMPPEVSTCPSEVSTRYSLLVILSMRVPVDTLRNTCLSNVICPQGVPKSTHFYQLSTHF